MPETARPSQVSLAAEDIRDAKVKVLRSMAAVRRSWERRGGREGEDCRYQPELNRTQERGDGAMPDDEEHPVLGFGRP